MTLNVEDALFELLEGLPTGKSVTPEQVARAANPVARAANPENWRRVLAQVKGVAVGLARQGRVVILRKGKPVNPEGLKGVYRLKAP